MSSLSLRSYHLKWPSTFGVVTISKEIEHDVKFWFEAAAKTLRPRPECLEAEAEAEAIFGLEASRL